MKITAVAAVAACLLLAGCGEPVGDTKVNAELLCKGTDIAACEAVAGCKWNHTKAKCKVDHGDNVMPTEKP